MFPKRFIDDYRKQIAMVARKILKNACNYERFCERTI